MKIIEWNNEIHDGCIEYLNKNAETAMFLLQNIEEHGVIRGKHQNSGNFYVALGEMNEILGIFVLANRGNVLFQLESSVDSNLVVDFLIKNESTPITGVLGENSRALDFWNIFKERNSELEESFSSCEILYSNNVNLDDYPDVENSMVFPKEKFETYLCYTNEFYRDQNLPDGSSKEQHLERFNYKVDNKHIWCLFDGGEILSMCSLNAKYKNIAQVGGVFTPSKYRSKGYSKKCMKKLIHDCIVNLNVEKIILFTASENYPAQKVYEAIGFNRIGHYGMYFGKLS